MRIFIRNYAVALISFFLFLLITTLLFRYLHNWSKEKSLRHFEFRTASAESSIKRRLSYYIELLKASKAYYNNTDTITREDWKNFVATLELKETFPGVQGIGFATIVHKNELWQHVSQMRASGIPDYEIKPKGERDYYSIIMFIEPMDWRNKRALGYDMFSDPIRRNAMELASSRNEAILSGKVLLIQEAGKDIQPGFLIYIPVYTKGVDPKSVEERHKNLKGFVYSPFRAHDLFKKILAEEFSDLDIEIYDGEKIKQENLLFNTDKKFDYGNNQNNNPFIKITKIENAGRTWTICYSIEPGFGFPDDNLPYFVLAGGIIISILIFFVMFGMNKSRRKQEESSLKLQQNAKMIHEANEKLSAQNNELKRINNDLDNFIYAASHDLKAPILNIEGLISAIKDTKPYHSDPEIKDLTELMNVSVNRFKSTILDLTEISKAQKSSLDQVEEINIDQLIEEVCFDIKDLIKFTDTTIIKDLKKKTISFSRKNIRSILYNLISNAIKYRSPDRKPEIFIQTDQVQNNIILYVKDNGLGIEPKFQDKIFTMFKRVHDHVEGSGVGLYIVKRIVDNAGGKIELISTPGEGSLFKIILPESNTPGPHFGIQPEKSEL